ncbi:MAG: hypothetical protein ONB14_08935 [candidate division KSB1 bacterium]|nr:hypothetical protein [candidate division KSB1 bacterium]MDZ7385784.1 hypothetical protein [candidate division KSB1 bacterium]MDZ7392190.1 hypothetical protein [candidate division KSB1 bacterium]MDZ7412625.1 hypothetical protein [candidate division KSB1 bacterium]
MGSLWDDIRKSLKEGLEKVADYTDEYTKIGRLKVDVAAIKHSINRLFAELGGRVYELISQGGGAGIASDEKVSSLVERIKTLEEKLRKKEADIEHIKQIKEEERKKKQSAAEEPTPPPAEAEVEKPRRKGRASTSGSAKPTEDESSRV